jgi:hypothetical protein
MVLVKQPPAQLSGSPPHQSENSESDIPFQKIAPAQAYAELKMSDICFPKALLL